MKQYDNLFYRWLQRCCLWKVPPGEDPTGLHMAYFFEPTPKGYRYGGKDWQTGIEIECCGVPLRKGAIITQRRMLRDLGEI